MARIQLSIKGREPQKLQKPLKLQKPNKAIPLLSSLFWEVRTIRIGMDFLTYKYKAGINNYKSFCIFVDIYVI